MAKKRKILQHKQKPKPVVSHKAKDRGPKSIPKSKQSDAKSGSQSTHPRDLEPTIPFSAEDSILLVGEGDLSFSKALVEHHYCENITTTVLEKDLEELSTKYPQVNENVDVIEAEGGKVLYGVDAKKMGPWTKKSGKESTGIFDRISMLHTSPPSLPLSSAYEKESFY